MEIVRAEETPAEAPPETPPEEPARQRDEGKARRLRLWLAAAAAAALALALGLWGLPTKQIVQCHMEQIRQLRQQLHIRAGQPRLP